MVKQQDRTLKTKKKILYAARFLFDSQGYEQSSVDQIAEHANVAKGTVFAHFTDKASLLTAVRIESLETISHDMLFRAKSPVGDDPTQAIVDILKPWLDLFANDRDFTQVFMDQASLRGGEWALRLYEACCSMETAITDMVTNMLKEGRLNPQTSVNIYVQGITAFFYHVLIGLQSGATENSKDQELLLRGLLQRWLLPE